VEGLKASTTSFFTLFRGGGERVEDEFHGGIRP
jgi:hypothetical protein